MLNKKAALICCMMIMPFVAHSYSFYVPSYAQNIPSMPLTTINEPAPEKYTRNCSVETLYTTFNGRSFAPEQMYYFFNNTNEAVTIVFRNSKRKTAPSGFKIAIAPHACTCLGGLMPPARLEVLDMAGQPFGYVMLPSAYHFYVWQGDNIEAFATKE